MSLPLCLFQIHGQTRIPKGKFAEIEGQDVSSLCASVPNAHERERMERTLRRASDATIESIKDRRAFVEAIVSYTRKTQVMGEIVEFPTEYRIWFRKDSSMLAVVGSSYTLSEAFAQVFLWLTAGDAMSLERIEFANPFLQRLGKWLLSSSHEIQGSVLKARFANAFVNQEGPFDEISLASHSLLESKTYKALAAKGGDPISINLLAPVFSGVSRQLSCVLTFRGILRISTQEVSSEEANRLLDEVEALVFT